MYTSSLDHTRYTRKRAFFRRNDLCQGIAAHPGACGKPGWLRTEPSGRGYFPGAFNGADVTVKDTKRFADTGGWGYFNFHHSEPKAPTAAVQPKSNCAFCHIAAAKRDGGVDAVLPHTGRSPAPPRCWREAAWAVTKQQEFGPVVSGYRTIGFQNRHDTG
jgi:Cytochrome P460